MPMVALNVLGICTHAGIFIDVFDFKTVPCQVWTGWAGSVFGSFWCLASACVWGAVWAFSLLKGFAFSRNEFGGGGCCDDPPNSIPGDLKH